jgi:hypothetical protein
MSTSSGWSTRRGVPSDRRRAVLAGGCAPSRLGPLHRRFPRACARPPAARSHLTGEVGMGYAQSIRTVAESGKRLALSNSTSSRKPSYPCIQITSLPWPNAATDSRAAGVRSSNGAGVARERSTTTLQPVACRVSSAMTNWRRYSAAPSNANSSIFATIDRARPTSLTRQRMPDQSSLASSSPAPAHHRGQRMDKTQWSRHAPNAPVLDAWGTTVERRPTLGTTVPIRRKQQSSVQDIRAAAHGAIRDEGAGLRPAVAVRHLGDVAVDVARHRERARAVAGGQRRRLQPRAVSRSAGVGVAARAARTRRRACPAAACARRACGRVARQASQRGSAGHAIQRSRSSRPPDARAIRGIPGPKVSGSPSAGRTRSPAAARAGRGRVPSAPRCGRRSAQRR